MKIMLLAVLLLAAALAQAQSGVYPSHPVKMVVTFSAGGGADAAGRLAARHLQDRLGQPFVVENRPGANGVVGLDYVAKSAPDGYTLVTASLGTVTPTFMKDLTLDVERDFAPVSLFYRGGFGVFIPASIPARTLTEFVAYVRANAGKLNNGTATPVTTLASGLFKKLAGIELVEVLYKGEPGVINDMLGGQIQMAMSTTTAYKPMIDAGRIRMVAATGETRSPVYPDIPTAEEQGYKGFTAGYSSGLWAAGGTPRNIIDRLNREFVAITQIQEVKDYFRNIVGAEALGSTPEAFRDMTRREQVFWAQAAKAANYKPE